ncbi:MAG: magnesium and cobalt transport protein CorA [Chlamydiales bacterium 38-26]|nr:magnesium/cobalt transporter CorA [Chlamydiales bacterium]OJV10867.1 MAG: magnesium and cobalt transport protein CorA [Chlamydiales bacterium 38-26]
MTSPFRRRIKKIGLPPGTLLSNLQFSPVKITVIDYSPESFIEKTDVKAMDCISYLQSPATTWIEVRGTSDIQTIQKIGANFGLHPLLLEDIVSLEQRPKLDDYKSNLYIVLRKLIHESSKKISDEQISIVLGKNFVISFQESLDDIFYPIKTRLRKENTNMRKLGADYLTYALIDLVVDHYFLVLEKIDQSFGNLEEELVNAPKSETLLKIQRAKRDIITLRKSVWPMRDVVSQFRRIETPLIQDTTKFYMHDVYDHTIQAIDTIESFRDLASSMLELYLSNINQRLNEIIKFLTIVSTIFCPLTFLTGFYGMNFVHMPLLNSMWGLPFIVLLMILVSLGMLQYFRKRKWI